MPVIALDILIDSAYETLSLFFYLYITYLFMEYLEHKTSKKTLSYIEKSDRLGPLLGGILGLIPQCGFSVAGANLYATRIITLGTLMAIFLSTSDEMLPILISGNIAFRLLVQIILLKVIFAICAGILIDTFLPKCFIKSRQKDDIKIFCQREQCKCDDEKDNIWKSAFKHTEKISIFIFIFMLVMNTIFTFGGKETLRELMNNMPIFSKIVASFVGLIPSCYPSVMFAQLYLEHSISLGTLMAGTLSNAGLGYLVLYRVNKDEKDNLVILVLLFGIGVVCGILTDILS